MGSYSAPSFALGYYAAIADVTNSIDDVLIGPVRCVDFMLRMEGSALYDGDIYVDLQNKDGTWYKYLHAAAINAGWYIISPQAHGLNYVGQDSIYPWSMRVRVETPPSVGSCQCRVITQPLPANPLF